MRVNTIKFSERAVAFIDLLGFKNLVREAHARPAALKRLSRLMRTIRSNEPLNRVVNHPVPRELYPKSLEISDSIILSTPLTHPDHSWYSGLAVIVMRCSQIAAILFEEGYLVTGAINVGPVHHTQHNIVGMAYQDAYERQSRVESPGIVLCPEAATAWDASPYRVGASDLCLNRAVAFKDKDSEGRPISNKREAIIVNVFNPTCMNSVRSLERPGPAPKMDDVWLSGRIKRIDELIQENVARFAASGSSPHETALAKWRWCEELFRDRGRPGLEQYLTLPVSLIG